MEEEILRDIVQRLARLEEAVENHIPGRLAHLESALHAVDARLWAVLAGVILTALAAWLR